MAPAIYDFQDGQSEENDPNTNPLLHEKDRVGAIKIYSAKSVIDNGLRGYPKGHGNPHLFY